jgi:uncharacterized protein Yka (UPF0111/DUF47 family)
MNDIQLIGAEQVSRAASSMRESAETMRRAAELIAESVRQLERALENDREERQR